MLTILCIFCTSSGFIKISILLFYRRLSSRVVSKSFRWATWLTIGFIVAYTIALTLAPILGCDPISAFWDQTNYTKLVKGYKYRCFDEGADVFIASIISAVQDLITAVLPTFLFWNLRIPLQQKVALFGIFAIGYGVVALGSLRAYYSWQIYYGTYDVTWVTWDLFLVSMLELHVGCFCANAPTFKVFFKHFFHEKLTSGIKKSKGAHQKGQGQSSGYSGARSEKSSASITEKITVFFSKDSFYDKNGYISGPHTGVSVDIHGGVLVQKEIQVDHCPAAAVHIPSERLGIYEPTATSDMFCNRYYDDIELSHFTTSHSSQVSNQHLSKIIDEGDVEALPPMPRSLVSSRSMMSFMSFKH